MKKIEINIPLITPLDDKFNVDYLSLEKIMFHIINLKYIDNIILFDKFSEYKFFTINEYIDIINCVINNNKKNINLILKINNYYNYDDLVNILNNNINKVFYNIILDYPLLNKIYKKDIIENYNKIFKKYKYLNFYFTFKNKKYIYEDILINIKSNNNNFIGIINETDYIFKNFNLINNLKIINNNDNILFNSIFHNYYGIISPLFLFFLDYIYNNILKNIYNNNLFLLDINFYELINFIKILYKKINTISGIKYLLNELKICNYYTKLPINNINDILEYKKLINIFNKIINKNNN